MANIQDVGKCTDGKGVPAQLIRSSEAEEPERDLSSGEKKEHKRVGVGAKKFSMSLEPTQTKLFGGTSRDFFPGYPGGARKV